MSQKSLFLRIALIVALVGAPALSAPRAYAQDDGDIVVHGAHHGTSDPNARVTRHVPISTADLNLHSDADVAILRQRVSDAATSVCDQIKDDMPTMSPDSYSDCRQEALRDGMREVSRVVGRARG